MFDVSMEFPQVRKVILHDLCLRIDMVQDASDLLLKLLVDDVGPVGHKVVKHGFMEELLRVICQPHEYLRVIHLVHTLGLKLGLHNLEHLKVTKFLIVLLVDEVLKVVVQGFDRKLLVECEKQIIQVILLHFQDVLEAVNEDLGLFSVF